MTVEVVEEEVVDRIGETVGSLTVKIRILGSTGVAGIAAAGIALSEPFVTGREITPTYRPSCIGVVCSLEWFWECRVKKDLKLLSSKT